MVRKDLKSFLATIPNNVIVVAATKYVGVDDLFVLYENGIKNFGENRVGSLNFKFDSFKKNDVVWHFIGHLQRNKVKSMINKIDYLHSLDSLDLARYIEKYRDKPLKCLVEVSINNEENKNGLSPNEVCDFINKLKDFSNIKVVGLMMMAIQNSDEDSLLKQFKKLFDLRKKVESTLNIELPHLSMGMSDDYLIAIKKGATMIRLGRILFDLE